jgi:uncharacterized protein (TIGR03083 family)
VPPPSAPPVDAVAPLVGLERSRLLGLLRSLAVEDWQRPTRCPEWSVLGVARHLLGDDLGLLSRRRDHYLGTPAPESLTEVQFIDWLDQLQIEWVRAARRLSPRLVVELLEWTGPRLVDVLSQEDLTVRSARVSWAGPEPVPVWLDQLRELSEYWIHRQQLLDALDRPADLDPLLLRPILLGLRWAFPYRLSQAGLPPGDAIRMTIGEPLDETWLLVLHDRTCEFSDRPEDTVTATASFSADQAWRLLTNNLAQPVADLDVHGDERAVQVIATTRAIIGHPQE